MRRHEQLSLERPYIEHSHAAELAKISQIPSCSRTQPGVKSCT